MDQQQQQQQQQKQPQQQHQPPIPVGSPVFIVVQPEGAAPLSAPGNAQDEKVIIAQAPAATTASVAIPVQQHSAQQPQPQPQPHAQQHQQQQQQQHHHHDQGGPCSCRCCVCGAIFSCLVCSRAIWHTTLGCGCIAGGIPTLWLGCSCIVANICGEKCIDGDKVWDFGMWMLRRGWYVLTYFEAPDPPTEAKPRLRCDVPLMSWEYVTKS